MKETESVQSKTMNIEHFGEKYTRKKFGECEVVFRKLQLKLNVSCIRTRINQIQKK